MAFRGVFVALREEALNIGLCGNSSFNIVSQAWGSIFGFWGSVAFEDDVYVYRPAWRIVVTLLQKDQHVLQNSNAVSPLISTGQWLSANQFQMLELI